VHITGSGNQINTGRVGGDQRQIHISGSTPEAAQHLATAQAKLEEMTAALEEHATELSNPDLARRSKDTGEGQGWTPATGGTVPGTSVC